MDNFNTYTLFLATQNSSIVYNAKIQEALPLAEKLLTEANKTKDILSKFPNLEMELSTMTNRIFAKSGNTITVNKSGIESLLSSYKPEQVIDLDKAIQKASSVDTEMLHLPEVKSFTGTIYDNSKLENISNNLATADYIVKVLTTNAAKLKELVKDLEKIKLKNIDIMQMLDKITSNCMLDTMEAKIVGAEIIIKNVSKLDNLIQDIKDRDSSNSTRTSNVIRELTNNCTDDNLIRRIIVAEDFLKTFHLQSNVIQSKLDTLAKIVEKKRYFPQVELSITHLERAVTLAERRDKVISTKDTHELGNEIDFLISAIEYDIKERQGERNKKIAKIIGVLAIVIFVIAFINPIVAILIELVTAVLTIVGIVLVIVVVFYLLTLKR